MTDDMKAPAEKIRELIERIDRQTRIEIGSLSNGRAWLQTVAQRMKEQSVDGQQPDPFHLTVRGLLSHFGYERRGAWIIDHIRNTLDEFGLQTIPNFENVWIGTEIAIHLNVVSSGVDAPELTVDATQRIGALDAAHINEGSQPGLNQSQGGMCICRVLGIGAGVSRECFGP